MGRFVEIELRPDLAAERVASVVRACPVDIFTAVDDGALGTVPEREDECLLCGRCIALAPGFVTVTRTYGKRGAVIAQRSGER